MAIEKKNAPPITEEQSKYLDADDVIEAAQGFEMDDGSIIFGPEEDEEELTTEFSDNLAEVLDENELSEIGTDLLALVADDEESRKDWSSILSSGMNLLGLKYEEMSEPFAGACAAVHPVLMESIVKFQAKAYSELLPPRGPVRTKIIGRTSPDKEAQARRVKQFMNYQIMHEMPEYIPEMDNMLLYLGFVGSAFKKTYYDQVLERPTSRYVTAENLIVNYGASDLTTAERYTHKFNLSGVELQKQIGAGVYRDTELESVEVETDEVQEKIGEIHGQSIQINDEENYALYEIHTNWAISVDGDGDIPHPYVITLDQSSGKVLSIRRNWKENDKLLRKRIWFTHYKLIPGLGFYGYGYLHLIGGLARTATSSMRQLIDAGTFANLQAGFKAHGLRVTGEDRPLQPGEWREINSAGMDVSKALVPIPYKEPSATLFNLLSFVVEAAQRFADATEQVVADSTNYGPVGTTMALLEASGKMFSAIHKRLHYSQMHDLKLLAEINAEHMPDVYPYEVEGGSSEIRRTDFDDRIDILPVSDPDLPSKSHRLAKAQTLHQVGLSSPQVSNMKEITREVIAALDYEDPDRFMIPDPPPPEPMDPITENMAALKGIPSGTAEWEEHAAHISIHMAFLNDPKFQQNQQAMMIILAHIQEHLAHQYRLDMQQLMGTPLPPPGEAPPEVQSEIARRAVEAARILQQKNSLEAEAMQMQQAMQDPTIALKAEELKLKDADSLRKHELEQGKLALEQEKMLRDDENEDLDREVDIYKVEAQAKNTIDAERIRARVKQHADLMKADADKQKLDQQNN